jgi:hypothetical protein
MRTTITLEPDVEELVTTAMRERGLSFKAAVNLGLRAGLGGPHGGPSARGDYSFPTYDLGARVDLTSVNRVIDELEDSALTDKIELGR